MTNEQFPVLIVEQRERPTVVARGPWQVQALAQNGTVARLRATIRKLSPDAQTPWDLSQINGLDHIGAQLLWNMWGRSRPAQLFLAPHHADFFTRIEQAGRLALPATPRRNWFSSHSLDQMLHAARHHLYSALMLIGQLVIDTGRFIIRPQHGPWKEISAHIFHIGYQALGITALVAFLIGVVLSFLSAQQLHTFGADAYLVNILGMSIIRELGPTLAAILVAGRSGSAITAQLGVMRVTEELDAMLVMGMPHGFRLIMPRVLALSISMPLLVLWTDAVALLGGMTAAKLELNLSFSYFLQKLPSAVPFVNYWIGLGKGVVFGSLIAIVACYFGLRIKANTESLGRGTTLSVVTSITVVILADAVFAILFKGVGFFR